MTMKHLHILPPARAAWLALALASLLPAGAWAQAGKTAVKPGEPVMLNFVNADIEAVARTVATLSGANVVVDPRVKGTMSLSSTAAVPPAQALRLFASQLRTQGFALVENSGIHTVVPEADAKLQSGPVNAGHATGGGGQVVTQIFRLNHENASSLVPVLRPLISPNNTINVTPGSNALVITDYADNLQRLGRIVAALDVANATGVDVIRLQHGLASDVALLVQRLLDASNSAAAGAPPTPGDGTFRTTVLADVRANALIVRAANAARLSLVRTLVEQLDLPAASGPGAASGNIHVVYLKNADAARLAVTLRAALAAEPRVAGATTGAGAAAGSSPAPSTPSVGSSNPGTASVTPLAQPSTGGQIQADPATNSLVITAPEAQYRQLREVIDRLDQRRAQVMVESLIAEVNADKAAQMGIQWQNLLGNKGGNVGVLGTNFGTTGNIVNLSTQGITATSSLPGGVNLGAFRYVNGTYMLAGLANFLEKNIGANVLSTPTLMTLDNEEAKIVVGKNVSFQTGNTTVNSGGVSSPFQTFERKDVGLTLRVKPQISETGTVKLNVYQEVSDVIKVNGSDTVSDRAFSKRAIETNVLVEDGGIIVLGGLLSDNFSDEKNQVPGLGDVPFLGGLFRNENRNRSKTNLMVFLRPVVLRDAEGTQAFSAGRYQEMIGLQQQTQPRPNPLLDSVNGAPVMRPLDAAAPPGTAPQKP
jgi:general secretion pathway protein D